MTTALPGPPQRPKPEDDPEPFSYAAYLDRNSEYIYAGFAVLKGDRHFLRFDLGPWRYEIIELVTNKPEFRPGIRKPERGEKPPYEPRPSFAAFMFGTEERIGTAFPNPKHDGHRLKFRQDLPDGTIVELRPTDYYYPVGEGLKRNLKPFRRPKISSFKQ